MERNKRGYLFGWAFLFIVVFLMFAIWSNPKTEEIGLESGNIEKAIQTGQYR